VDRIKLTAYNAEEWLLERLLVHYPHPNDARALLRSFFQLPGEMHANRTLWTAPRAPPGPAPAACGRSREFRDRPQPAEGLLAEQDQHERQHHPEF
jgi:hypothetical protein